MIKKIKSSPFAIFLCKKISFLLFEIFLAGNLVFIFPRLMPSNPADLMIGRIATGGGITPIGTSGGSTTGTTSSLEILRQVYAEKFGIYEPLHIQYIDFWKRLITMDFGLSYWKYPTPVSTLIMKALPWTIALILPVLPLGFVIGNWIGSRAAYNRGRLDRILYNLSMYLAQAPYYWFAMILMLIAVIIGAQFGWPPPYGAYSSEWVRPVLRLDWFLDALWHYILPFLSLVGSGVGGWAIGMRAMILHEMEADYIHYARQLGFSSRKIRKYAEHNAILPNFTWIPLALSGLVSQTLLVEIVFGYPGIGTLLYNAVFALDYPLIEAGFIATVLLVLLGNFIVDILYGKIDPRIATGYIGEK